MSATGVSPGGSPELFDADLSAALRREALEESQAIVTQTAYLGYQEVQQPGCAPHAQVWIARARGQVPARYLRCEPGGPLPSLPASPGADI